LYISTSCRFIMYKRKYFETPTYIDIFYKKCIWNFIRKIFISEFFSAEFFGIFPEEIYIPHEDDLLCKSGKFHAINKPNCDNRVVPISFSLCLIRHSQKKISLWFGEPLVEHRWSQPRRRGVGARRRIDPCMISVWGRIGGSGLRWVTTRPAGAEPKVRGPIEMPEFFWLCRIRENYIILYIIATVPIYNMKFSNFIENDIRIRNMYIFRKNSEIPRNSENSKNRNNHKGKIGTTLL
jgi:hypothetical protein